MEKATKRNVYQIVTEKIIAKLEQGVAPWRRPWRLGHIPYNLKSGKTYRGINLLLLGMQDYEYHAYLSFKQVTDMNGSVMKGEKGHPVVFWKRIKEEPKEGDEPTWRYLLRYYTVFNVEQCANIPAKFLPKPLPPFDPIQRCEEILYHMPRPPRIEEGGDEAAYDPALDTVYMPEPKTFDFPENYYGILFHELVHSTGHEKRLARKELGEAFGSEPYAKEELTAEIGAGFLRAITGIDRDGFDQNAAYVKGWLNHLKDDPRLIVHAAGKAQKAVDYILGIKGEPENEEP